MKYHKNDSYFLNFVYKKHWSASGVTFMTLEDETGLLNIVVLPDVWARHRNLVRKSPALVIHGRLEYHDGVTNIVARDFDPLGVRTVKSRDFR